jgi:hypothetical protein
MVPKTIAAAVLFALADMEGAMWQVMQVSYSVRQGLHLRMAG